MVQTSLGHFLQLPHMDKVCDDWETKYQNHQASLNNDGVTNSIVSHTAVDSICAKLTALCAVTQTKDEQFSFLVDQLQQSVVTPPTVSDIASIPSVIPTPTVIPSAPDIMTIR